MPAFGLKSPDQSDDLIDDDEAAISDTTQSSTSPTKNRASLAWMVFLYLQALLSIIGSTVYWTGAFNLLNLYVLPKTPIANCISSASGLIVFIVIRAIVGSHGNHQHTFPIDLDRIGLMVLIRLFVMKQ
jgi:hypothetical protein